MNIGEFHRLNGIRAAAAERRSNPTKTWPCRARNLCSVCGTMMEVDEPVRSDLKGWAKVCHARCQ